MEDPVRFDVWGRVLTEGRDGALEFVRSQSTYASEKQLRFAVSRSVQGNKRVLIAASCGWAAANELTDAASKLFADIALCQEGYSPSKTGSYCEVHKLHYGGCLGCHVCQDFYAR